jgi:hypothetical protein
VAAIDGFQMQMGTAVGNAIVMSLSELFPDHGIDVGDMTFGSSKRQGRSLDDKVKPPPKQITPVAPGSYNSAAIILLSDGRRTTGVDTLAAAKMAADRGVRIYVVGLGTVDGAAATPEGMPIYMQLDETDAARSGAHDRRRIPPRRHGGEAAQRLRDARLAAAGADARDRADGADRAAVGAGGDHGSGAVGAVVRKDRTPLSLVLWASDTSVTG